MSFPELLHINVPSRLWEWEKSTEHIVFVTCFSVLVFTVTLDLHRHHLGSVRVTFVSLLFLHRLSLSPCGPSVFLSLVWHEVMWPSWRKFWDCKHWNVDIGRPWVWGIYSYIHYSVYTLFSGFAENMQFSCLFSCCRSVCKHKIGFSDFQAI